MKLFKTLLTLALVSSFGLLCSCFAFGDNGDVKEPPYTLIQQSGEYEVRRYAPMILAQVTRTGSWDRSSNSSFRDLFRYIDGQNTTNTRVAMTTPVLRESENSQKIPMTAPVFIAQDQSRAAQKIPMTAPVLMEENTADSQKTWTMSFVMPAAFTLENTPQPLNPNVKIVSRPAQQFAVIRFSGYADAQSREVHTAKLLNWLADQQLTPIGDPIYAGYNAPFVLPNFRRNEILIEVN
ncbi:MAG: heme-binding protein [Candidatus Sericytochromatia bacterium]|nr:heme-binding protein [Candidatus Sericytochromatia bacterium]